MRCIYRIADPKNLKLIILQFTVYKSDMYDGTDP
jgi:hypothetical protein